MIDFYCSGCSKWVREPHYCPSRKLGDQTTWMPSRSRDTQRERLLRRKVQLERELREVNARLGGVR